MTSSKRSILIGETTAKNKLLLNCSNLRTTRFLLDAGNLITLIIESVMRPNYGTHPQPNTLCLYISDFIISSSVTKYLSCSNTTSPPEELPE
jgi:hypothetical protein